jgi:RND family efflux transporter MFP subunit
VSEPDLQQLKIDRSASQFRRRSSVGGRIAWIVLLAAIAAGVWLFRSPLESWLDALRLPQVSAHTVVKANPAAAGAISGTAANGYIIAAKRAALSADAPGRIVEMNVTEGTVVKQGQVVARLYSDEHRAALKRAEAALAAHAATLDRVRADADAARLDVAAREADIERTGAQIAENTAAVGLAEIKLARAERLLAEGVSDAQTVDNAKAELVHARGLLETSRADRKSAEAGLARARGGIEALEAAVRESEAQRAVLASDVEQARATLDKTEVRAPFDGIVVLKDAEVGEVVSPNTVGGNARGSVATMVDWSSLEVQVELQETNLDAAKVGASATIYLDAYPDHAYAGKVLRIWPTANRTKATVEIRVGFEAPDDKLRPEMGGRVVFAASAGPAAPAGEAAILIPRAAVVPIAGATSVFVLERDVVRVRPVVLGDERSGRVVVKSGLAGGEKIVAAPPASLDDGDRVRVKE